MPRIEVKKTRTVSGIDLHDQPLTIGRSSENALVLSDTRISRKHCVIETVSGTAMLRDLNSQRGTFVNGERVTEHPLHDGDRIKIGPFEIIFQDPSTPAASLAVSRVTANGIAATESQSSQNEFERLRAQLESDRNALEEHKSSLEAARTEWDAVYRNMETELNQRAEQLGAQAAQQDQRAADLERKSIELNAEKNHQHLVDSERIAALQQLLDVESRHRTEDNQRIGSLTQQLESGRQQIEQLTAAAQGAQQRIEALESSHRLTAQRLQQELTAKINECDRLRLQETALKRQVETLEIARQALSEKATSANQAMNVLRSQVHTLDGAAQRVTALQMRLAEIEDAWVQADQDLSEAEQDDPQVLEAAMQQRQRMSAQLDSLNRERDAAVAVMRDSAERLLAISQQSSLALAAPLPKPQVAATEAQKKSLWKRLMAGQA